MNITQANYTEFKNKFEGKHIDSYTLNEIYGVLVYLTCRMNDEPAADRWWTAHQISNFTRRQRTLLADKGIYVLRG